MADASGTSQASKGLLGRLPFLRAPAGVKTETVALAATPTGYRTFSRKLAPALIGSGGALAVAGGLGAWVRTSRVTSEGLAEEQVAAVMGHTSDWGRLVAALGALAVAASVVWLGRRRLPKLASVLISGAVVGIVIWRLVLVDQLAGRMAEDARTGEIDFISFHAGFGWGAWCLVVAGIALTLGAIVGILREIDLWRGMPE